MDSYVGQLIAANPANPKGSLERSVILIVTHTEEMTLGLQINRPMLELSLSDISDQIGIFIDCDDPVYYGGSVNSNKIHVIHSNDWSGLTTVNITKQISVTNDLSVLTALAGSEGPEKYKACAGFWAWEAGQLEAQLKGYGKSVKYRWEMIPATPRLIFDSGNELDQWNTVIKESAKAQISNWF